MSGGVVLVIVIVLFIFVIAGFNNEVKSKSEAMEQKRISKSNSAKIQQLKQEIKPIEVPQRREIEITEYVQITSDYFNQIRFELGLMYMDSKPDKDGLYTILKSDLIEAERSIEETKKSLNILHNSTECYGIARKYEFEGNIEKAIELYEKSISLRETCVNSFVSLARIYEQKEDYGNMIRVCKKGIKHHKGYCTIDNYIKLLNDKYIIEWNKPYNKCKVTKNESVRIRSDYFTSFLLESNLYNDYHYYLHSDNNGIIELPKSIYNKIENIYQPYLEKERKDNEMSELVKNGVELEKQGNYEEAIKAFETALPYRWSFSNFGFHFDRLLIIYRKLKDYENEKRVCLAAIERLGNKKYKDRLLTIEDKINKAIKQE